MPDPDAKPAQPSVADVVAGRTPNGRFAEGNTIKRGPDRQPRKSIVRAIVLQALAGAQYRGKGKSRQLVKAAAMTDSVIQLQRILAGKGAGKWARPFLDALEMVREIVDEDTQGAASMRRTLFVLAGDYQDNRQVHVHSEGEGPEQDSGPLPVPTEPIRDANGNVMTSVEPLE